MSEKFYIKGNDIESIYKRKDNIIQSFVGSSSFSTMNQFGFESTDSTQFVKGLNLCSNRWGKVKQSLYRFEGSSIPFADPTTMPIPYLKAYNTSQTSSVYRHFPTNDITASDNHGTAVKYISLSKSTTVTISYNKNTGKLLVDSNGTNVANLSAYPTVIVDVQAAGGMGGGADHWNEVVVVANNHHMAGGGGGGSGALASFVPYLDYCTITLNTKSDGTVEISSDTTPQETIRVGAGEDGSRGEINYDASRDYYSRIAGSGGGGGSVRAVPADGNSRDASVMFSYDHLYLLDAIKGTTGYSGSTALGFYSDRPSADGKGPSNDGSDNRCPASGMNTVVKGITVPCSVINTTGSTMGGWGEQISNSSATIICGGGGGAPSLMSNGGSHGSTPSVGAGGAGGSAWGSSNTASDHSETGNSGGSAAMWIYYIPIS